MFTKKPQKAITKLFTTGVAITGAKNRLKIRLIQKLAHSWHSNILQNALQKRTSPQTPVFGVLSAATLFRRGLEISVSLQAYEAPRHANKKIQKLIIENKPLLCHRKIHE